MATQLPDNLFLHLGRALPDLPIVAEFAALQMAGTRDALRRTQQNYLTSRPRQAEALMATRKSSASWFLKWAIVLRSVLFDLFRVTEKEPVLAGGGGGQAPGPARQESASESLYLDPAAFLARDFGAASREIAAHPIAQELLGDWLSQARFVTVHGGDEGAQRIELAKGDNDALARSTERLAQAAETQAQATQRLAEIADNLAKAAEKRGLGKRAQAAVGVVAFVLGMWADGVTVAEYQWGAASSQGAATAADCSEAEQDGVKQQGPRRLSPIEFAKRTSPTEAVVATERSALSLRREPVIKPGNVLTVLKPGATVQRHGVVSGYAWVRYTDDTGQNWEGWAFDGYLRVP